MVSSDVRHYSLDHHFLSLLTTQDQSINSPLTLGAEGAPGTLAGLADDAAAFTGATTTGAGAALAASFLTGLVLTTGTSSSLSESRAAKLFILSIYLFTDDASPYSENMPIPQLMSNACRN